MSEQSEHNGTLAIGEAARRSGRSAYALRYYEDIGLIPAVGRNRYGHRRYTEEHLRWIEALDQLRATGMPIHRLKRYAELAARGPDTLEARRELLDRHRRDLERRVREIERFLDRLAQKIEMHRNAAGGMVEDAACVTMGPIADEAPANRAAGPIADGSR